MNDYWQEKVEKVTQISRDFGYSFNQEFWKRQTAGIISLILAIYDSKILVPTGSSDSNKEEELSPQEEKCIKCEKVLLGNCTQVKDNVYPLFKCNACGTVNFWD